MFQSFKLLLTFILLESINCGHVLNHENYSISIDKNAFVRAERVIGPSKRSTEPSNWAKQILYKGTDNKCTASVIDEKWLISAASCLWDKNVTHYTIGITPEQNPVGVDKIVILPKYNPTFDAGYDIALIKLKFRLILKDYNKIPSNNFKLNKAATCRVGHAISSKEFSVTLDDDKDCASKYGDSFDNKLMICAYSNEDACVSKNSATGAPLLCQTGEGWRIVAIASWGQKVCGRDHPDVFTKLYDNEYNKWISDTIAKN